MECLPYQVVSRISSISRCLVVWCISNWLELALRCSQGVTIKQQGFGKPVTQWFQWYTKETLQKSISIFCWKAWICLQCSLHDISLSFYLFRFNKNRHVIMFCLRHLEQTLCVGNKLPSSRATAIRSGTTEGITGISRQPVAVASVCWGARCCMAAWSWQGPLREVGSQMENL